MDMFNFFGYICKVKYAWKMDGKEEQKHHLIDMMKFDEELGLYDESQEIKLEDIFNEEKKEKLKKFISEHKKLKNENNN